MLKSPRPRILVADDDASVREFLAFSLERFGFEVLEAEAGHQIVEMVGHHNPDLVVLDIMMPGTSGHEVLREIRASGSNAAVIMLTGLSSDHVYALEG